MKLYNPKIHNRRSIRLKGYDYSKAGLYFLTLCVQDRKNIFGKITNGKMELNHFGIIANEEWLATPKIRKNISLGEHIIMPNHMHGIISIDYKIETTNKNQQGKFHSPSQTIGAIIRGYKGATTKRINNLIRELKSNPSGRNELNFLENSSGLNSSKNSGELNSYKSTGELQFAPTAIPQDILNSLPGTGSIWQRNYYEIIIRTEEAYLNITNYIKNNPKNWKKDKFGR